LNGPITREKEKQSVFVWSLFFLSANRIVACAFLAKAINMLFKSRPLKGDGNEIVHSYFIAVGFNRRLGNNEIRL
jgi:hypothetical protein